MSHSTFLQPLYVEGQKYGGKELVTLNLPSAPKSLLSGVINSFDSGRSHTTAGAADIAAGVTMPTSA